MNRLDEIIDNVWLGNYSAAENIKDLKSKGITKILSILGPDDDIFYKNEDAFIHKKYTNIEDLYNQNIIQYFGECLNFIKGNEKVLVHCRAGASRSATIVIAFVMWVKKMKFLDALGLTQKKRFIVCPNPGFKSQLKKFQKLLIKNNYNIDKINFKEIKWDPKDEEIDIDSI